MRFAPLLLLLLAIPLVGAQAQAEPSLTVEPREIAMRPSGEAHAQLLLGNPTGAELTFTFSFRAQPGVKTTFSPAEVKVGPGTRALIDAAFSVPDADNVSYTVTLGAQETAASARAAGRAAPMVLKTDILLVVGAGPKPVRTPDPQPVADIKATLAVRPAIIEVLAGGVGHGVLVVHNTGTASFPLTIDALAPPGLAIQLEDAPARLAAGDVAEIPFTLRDEAGDARGPLRAKISLPGVPAPPAAYEVRVVAAPAPPERSDEILLAGAAAGVAAGWTGLYLSRRHWWPLLLALYTRLRPSKMLDHPVRSRIVEVVKESPGITFGDLARRVGIAPGQLTHHARMLEKAGIVFSSPDGQTRRFFHVAEGRLAPVAPLPERALAMLRERPRTMSELARELGVSRQALHYHVKQLVAEGALIAQADGTLRASGAPLAQR